MIDTGRQRGWDGEPYALPAAAVAGNQSIDAYDFALEVDERSAAVSGIDRRVGLNQIAQQHVAVGLYVTMQRRESRTDDATR